MPLPFPSLENFSLIFSLVPIVTQLKPPSCTNAAHDREIFWLVTVHQGKKERMASPSEERGMDIYSLTGQPKSALPESTQKSRIFGSRLGISSFVTSPRKVWIGVLFGWEGLKAKSPCLLAWRKMRCSLWDRGECWDSLWL